MVSKQDEIIQILLPMLQVVQPDIQQQKSQEHQISTGISLFVLVALLQQLEQQLEQLLVRRTFVQIESQIFKSLPNKAT